MLKLVTLLIEPVLFCRSKVVNLSVILSVSLSSLSAILSVNLSLFCLSVRFCLKLSVNLCSIRNHFINPVYNFNDLYIYILYIYTILFQSLTKLTASLSYGIKYSSTMTFPDKTRPWQLFLNHLITL